MRRKIYESVTKFINLDINSFQVSVYFNVYMITSVFFGYGVITLIKKEEKELQRIYKEPILVKMGLSRKFLWTILYTRKSILGIGLMKPSTIIDILKLKLYIRNKQKEGNAKESIEAHEGFQKIEASQNLELGEDSKQRY